MFTSQELCLLSSSLETEIAETDMSIMVGHSPNGMMKLDELRNYHEQLVSLREKLNQLTGNHPIYESRELSNPWMNN